MTKLGPSQVPAPVESTARHRSAAVAHMLRTLLSDLAAIVGAEAVFRVRPRELEQATAACGPTAGERRGMAHLPGVHRAWWTANLSVNHIASFGKSSA